MEWQTGPAATRELPAAFFLLPFLQRLAALKNREQAPWHGCGSGFILQKLQRPRSLGQSSPSPVRSRAGVTHELAHSWAGKSIKKKRPARILTPLTELEPQEENRPTYPPLWVRDDASCLRRASPFFVLLDTYAILAISLLQPPPNIGRACSILDWGMRSSSP